MVEGTASLVDAELEQAGRRLTLENLRWYLRQSRATLVGAILMLFIPREAELAHKIAGNVFGALGFLVARFAWQAIAG